MSRDSLFIECRHISSKNFTLLKLPPANLHYQRANLYDNKKDSILQSKTQ